MLNDPHMDSAAPDRSFGGVSFVTRTGDRKSKTGVVQLKSIDGSEGVLTSKPKKLLLKVDRQNLGIHSKDGKNLLQQFPVEMCSFKMSDDNGYIEAVCPGLRFAVLSKGKEGQSWLLALKTNASRTGLSGAPSESTKASKRKDSLGFVLNEPPKPHLVNRKPVDVTLSKPKNASMGMKVCGGGGPDGDPNRPEIFVFSLESGGVAEKAGLARGDIVISVDKVALTGMDVGQAAKELSRAGGDAVKLRILRKTKKHSTREDLAGVGQFDGKKSADSPKKSSEKKSKTPDKPKKRSKKEQKKADAAAKSGDGDENFGFEGLESPPADVSGESFGFGSEEEASKSKPEAKPTPAEVPSSPAPTSPDQSATPGDSARAARLAKLREMRKSKRQDWEAELMASLKIIDDLEE